MPCLKWLNVDCIFKSGIFYFHHSANKENIFIFNKILNAVRYVSFDKNPQAYII